MNLQAKWTQRPVVRTKPTAMKISKDWTVSLRCSLAIRPIFIAWSQNVSTGAHPSNKEILSLEVPDFKQ
jgi:hypothetical protein